MKSGVNLICEERARQKSKHNWTEAHDDGHDDGNLALAAACYATPKRIYIKREFAVGLSFGDPFPWEGKFDARPHDGNVLLKVDPSPVDQKQRQKRIRLLVKAGALLAAEIDRLHRISSKKG